MPEHCERCPSFPCRSVPSEFVVMVDASEPFGGEFTGSIVLVAQQRFEEGLRLQDRA